MHKEIYPICHDTDSTEIYYFKNEHNISGIYLDPLYTLYSYLDICLVWSPLEVSLRLSHTDIGLP